MRLTNPAIVPAVAPCRIAFDGTELDALPGETVAAALTAAGILAFRATATGAPRGLWCGMGACFDCLVTIDGKPSQRACLTKVADGMQIGSTAPADPAPLTPLPSAIAERACDVLVVGGGPAGLTAAIAAARAGAQVVLLEERDAPGGQYLKPLAPSHRNAAPDRQHRLGDALRAEALAAGVTLQAGATVWGAFAPDEIAAILDDAAVTFRPRRLILAAGAHEAPVPIPGWTLPGVMTTGALQTLARANRVVPGERVLIAGNGPLNLQTACELLDGGARVVAVVEAAARPGFASLAPLLRLARSGPDLAWDGFRYVKQLRAAGVPILWGSRVLAAEGETRFAALRVATPQGERRLEADACALNLGFQPETGLARALGCAQRFVDAGLGRLETVTDAWGRTSRAEIFAIGDGAAIGGARVALARGRLAGLRAAVDLGFPPGETWLDQLGDPEPDDRAAHRALARAEAFQAALWTLFAAPAFDVAGIADATIVCRCEEITAGTLRAEREAGSRSLAALKKATRAGMGRCQGRMCGAVVARLSGATAEAGLAAPRAPVKPIPASALMLELPEWGEAELVAMPALPAWRPGPTPPERPEDCDVLVIGGGVLGLATALYLAREGTDVLLVDRAEAGMAASTANAGSLHVQLLSYDFGDHAIGGGEGAAQTLPLGPESIALWGEVAAAAGSDLGIRTEGGLMLAETPEELAWLRGKSATENARGIRSEVLGANELRSVAPYLDGRFIGAEFCPGEGQMDPLAGTIALRKQAVAAGTRLRENAEVQAIRLAGAGFEVTTSAGPIRAGRIVNCAGPFAARIGAMLGVPLPVIGTVQQVIATEAAAPVMRHLVAHASRHLSLKQGFGGHVLVGGGWPGDWGADGAARTRRRSVEGNLWIAGRVLPALAGLHAIRAWNGMNVQIDRAPIIGETPGIPGLFHAVTSNGYTLGPVTARLAADAVLGRSPAPRAFSLARFG